MCNSLYQPEVNPKGFVAYKKVTRHGRKGWYISFLFPGYRSRQPGFPSSGTEVTYKTNKMHRSPMPETPGFYLQRTGYPTGGTIRVWIPKGAMIRRGERNSNVFTADRLRVLGLV